MEALKKHLIEKAKSLYGAIDPCSGLNLDQCFTVYDDQLCFWFNVQKNTHMVTAQIGENFN